MLACECVSVFISHFHFTRFLTFNNRFERIVALHADASCELGAGLSDMTTCPSERLLDKIIFAYKEKADAVDLRYPEKLQLVTTLAINQEPIILQVRIRSYYETQ